MNDSSESNSAATGANSLYILRDEYVRLSKRYESLVDSAFEDFKMLAAIGFFISWPAISQSDLFGGAKDSCLVLFMGFVGILFIIVIIATRDLVKSAITEFYLQEMFTYESEIRDNLGFPTDAFLFAHNWPKYRKERYLPIFIRFSLLFVVILLLPAGILILRGSYLFGILYLVSFMIAVGIYLWAVRYLRVL